MNASERRRLFTGGRLACLLALVLLILAGRVVSEERREAKNLMRQTHAVNMLRLEVRERLTAWRQAHPGAPDPLLPELGVSPDGRFDADGKFALQAFQANPANGNVTVRLFRPGASGSLVRERSMTWEAWSGPDFEFTIP